MAQLKDLIVNGPSRFIGDVYATTFTGNLAGNANTATNATNAGMIAGLSVHSGRNNEANKIVRTDRNGYLQVGYINSSSGHEKNASNPTYVWGSNSSDSYLRSYQTSSLSVSYATSSGSCSGNAATVSRATFGDASNGEHNCNNIASNGLWYYNAGGPSGIGESTHDGALYSQAYSTSWVGQIAQDYRNGHLFIRGKNNGSWQNWLRVIDSSNISSQSVNYATTSGSCSGNAATATNASSAKDADKLDGVHYQNILERHYSGSASSGTATGWFRIAETLVNEDFGPTFLLAIQRSSSYVDNESYLFSISISFGGGISITQLSGYANIGLITKIRIDWDFSQIAYVDLYINTSSTNNNYYWYTVGCAKSYTTWTANPTLVGYAHNFTTVQGCKSDKGFTGYLTGTASSASKWVYARTITLTGSVTGSVSIDGSGDVSLATTTNHTHSYLPLSGGTMSNTNVVTNLNADLLDGYHASYFASAASLGNYLPLTGGTLTGTAGVYTPLVIKTYSLPEVWIQFHDINGTTHIGSANGIPCINSGGSNQTIIHSGNYNSYAPKLDGTGATGTWGINISGNASSATKLQNSRTIWGHNFDGTGNVDGTLRIVANAGNYQEGIRIQPYDKWSTFMLLGTDATASGSGSSSKSWGIFNNDGNFYINRSSSSVHTGYELCNVGGNWGIGTVSPSYKLHVNGDGYFTENVITESDFISRGDAIIDGNVGIGTNRPDYNLDVYGNMRIVGPIWLDILNSNGKYFISTEDGFLGITYDGRDQNPAFLMNSLGYVYLNCDTPESPAYPLVVNGTIQCTKLLQTSDIKYKTNIKQIEYEEALKIIENLNPVTWDWNENTVETGSSSGFVAQEAEEFIPNAISRDNENNLSLDYTQLHSYEIKVIQEQQKEIIKLKEKLKILEKLIS